MQRTYHFIVQDTQIHGRINVSVSCADFEQAEEIAINEGEKVLLESYATDESSVYGVRAELDSVEVSVDD